VSGDERTYRVGPRPFYTMYGERDFDTTVREGDLVTVQHGGRLDDDGDLTVSVDGAGSYNVAPECLVGYLEDQQPAVRPVVDVEDLRAVLGAGGADTAGLDTTVALAQLITAARG